MKNKAYIKLQKEYGGKWVATSPKMRKVYAVAETIEILYDELSKKNIPKGKTTIGHVEEYGATRLGPNLYIPPQTD